MQCALPVKTQLNWFGQNSAWPKSILFRFKTNEKLLYNFNMNLLVSTYSLLADYTPKTKGVALHVSKNNNLYLSAHYCHSV